MSKNNSSQYIYGNTAYKLEEKVIKDNPPIKNRFKMKKVRLVVSICIVFTLFLLTLFRFTTILKISSEIRTIKRDISSVQKENENLNIEIAKNTNIKNIEKVAVANFGMVEAQKDDINYIEVKPLTSTAKEEDKSTFQLIQKLFGLIY